MNIMFLGTPDFAVPSLRSLAGSSRHRVVGVITNPDQPSGRSLKMTPPPVKIAAAELGIPVFQPEKFNTAETIDLLKSLSVDLLAVVAYGKIIGDRLISLYPGRIINVHPSLLPEYRGVAPYQWAIVNGETETGVTIIQIVKELDAGDMIIQKSCPIGPDENASELHDRLAAMGAAMISEAADLIESGSARPVPQDHSKATYFKKIEKSSGRIDWTRDAASVHNLVRGFSPWPSTFTFHGGDMIKVHRTRIAALPRPEGAACGTVISADEKNGLAVACGTGVVMIEKLQLASRNIQSYEAFLRGYRLPCGSALN